MLQCYCDYIPDPGDILWEYQGGGLAPVERSRSPDTHRQVGDWRESLYRVWRKSDN